MGAALTAVPAQLAVTCRGSRGRRGPWGRTSPLEAGLSLTKCQRRADAGRDPGRLWPTSRAFDEKAAVTGRGFGGERPLL